MLAIVDDQEKMLVLDMVLDLFGLNGAGDLQASSNRRPNEAVLGDASHLDEVDPISERRSDRPANLQSQPCLSDPTRTCERDESISRDEPPDFGAFLFASQQRGE